jgi:3-dehydroquinate synthase
LFESIERGAERILARDPAVLRAIVLQSCRIKAEVVGRDEREETGARAVLNLGHTVAHAIETVAGYEGRYEHGEAVAIGMVVECRIAERLRMLKPEVGQRVARLLARFGLPSAAPELPVERLIEAMSRDKKNRGGVTRFVLPRRLGIVELVDSVSALDVRAAWEQTEAPR